MKNFFILSLTMFILSVNAQTVSDSLVRSFNTNPDDSLRVDAALQLYDHMIGKYPDSLYHIIDDALALAAAKGMQQHVLKLMLLKGQVFDRLNDFVKAQQIYFSTDRVLDSIRITMPDSTYIQHKISLVNDIAHIFFRTNKLDDARRYYEQIITILEGSEERERPSRINNYYLIAYNNIGSVYLQAKEYDLAESYYLKAMPYIHPGEKKYLSTILNNLGIIEKDRGNYEKAMDYLTRATQLRRELNFLEGEVQSLNNYGDLLWKMGQTRKALDTLKKVSQLAKDHQLLNSYNIAQEKLAGIYYDLGEYRNAYLTHKNFKEHYDSLMNQENLQNITRLEMQQRFEQTLNEEKLLRQKDDLIRQRRETIYFFITISSILLLALLVMMYALQRSKLKRHQLAADKDKLKQRSLLLENEKLNLNLEYKNKELTTNVIYLARTNEFISELAEKLMKRRIYFARENQKLIDELIHDIQNFSDRDTWREFEIRFQEVHSEFYSKLIEKFPDLSANEKKLCAFLRLNMTTKEISAITYQSLNSITVARSRLRKKLGIDKDENLIAFLEKL